MAGKSSFDADKLRGLIEKGKDFSEIKTELGVSKTTLNSYLLKLIQQDKKFYTIKGISTRDIIPKVTKNGFKISLAKMEEYGFTKDSKIKIEKIADGAIKIIQITTTAEQSN